MSLVKQSGGGAPKRSPFDSLKKAASAPLLPSNRRLDLLLDVSSSMGVRCSSGRAAIEELEDAARATIAEYSSRVEMSAVLFGTVNERRVLRVPVKALPKLEACGGTPMHLAIYEFALASAGSHAILMSDGRPDDPRSVRAAVESVAASKVIHTIACGPGADEELLKWIANRTGGKFFRLGDAIDLPNAFLELARVAVAALTTGQEAIPAGGNDVRETPNQ